ncbi:3'-5' exonuclease [Erysipelotrichaceae bacterium HCN-30851]
MAFDVETTGLYPNIHKIIEIGVVLFEEGEIIKTFGTLVNPGVPVPKRATAIITNAMVKAAPKEEEVYKELVDFLGDALDKKILICAHNAKFDISFLSETLMNLGYEGIINYVDTLSISRRLIPGLDNYKQDTVEKLFNIINKESHRAVTDAEVCGQILWQLLRTKG